MISLRCLGLCERACDTRAGHLVEGEINSFDGCCCCRGRFFLSSSAVVDSGVGPCTAAKTDDDALDCVEGINFILKFHEKKGQREPRENDKNEKRIKLRTRARAHACRQQIYLLRCVWSLIRQFPGNLQSNGVAL